MVVHIFKPPTLAHVVEVGTSNTRDVPASAGTVVEDMVVVGWVDIILYG